MKYFLFGFALIMLVTAALYDIFGIRSRALPAPDTEKVLSDTSYRIDDTLQRHQGCIECDTAVDTHEGGFGADSSFDSVPKGTMERIERDSFTVPPGEKDGRLEPDHFLLFALPSEIEDVFRSTGFTFDSDTVWAFYRGKRIAWIAKNGTSKIVDSVRADSLSELIQRQNSLRS